MIPGRRTRRVLVWVVGVTFGLMFALTGWEKFDADGSMATDFARWGYPAWLRLAVGVVEIVGGMMLIVPRLASYGALGLGVVMVGAWITRLGDGRIGDVVLVTILGVVLAWIAFERWPTRTAGSHDPT